MKNNNDGAQKESQVSSQFYKIEQNLDLMDRVTDSLEKRLEMVLKPLSNQPEQEAKDIPEEKLVPLADRLRNQDITVKSLITRLESIIMRLEL